MPTSVKYGKKITREAIEAKFETGTILDIGPGKGTYWELLHDKYTLDCVEIFEPYIVKFGLRDKYRYVWNCDVRDFMSFDSYEVIIMGDILEHLSVEDSVMVLNRLKGFCKMLVIQVPFQYKQSSVGGNKHEEHIQDDLTLDLFNERYPGFTTLGVSSNGRHGVFVWEAHNV